LRATIVPRVPLLADAGRRALGLLDGRLLDERLHLAVQVSRLGCRRAGMACSSVAAAMSFWLARGGVSGLSTLQSVLMRSRACLPSSRARSSRAEASPAMEARSSRTVRYSSASLASSSRAWANCVLMSAPSAVKREGPWPRGQARCSPQSRGNLSVAGAWYVGGICWVVGNDDAALPRGVVAPSAGVVVVAEPVVRGVEEPPEHYWVRHTGEVPLRISMRGGGWQRVG
jgi:hypothetical protein